MDQWTVIAIGIVAGLALLFAIVRLSRKNAAGAVAETDEARGAENGARDDTQVPGDENELVAVIAAAICATTGMAAESFRIRSVAQAVPGGFHTPEWGRIERGRRDAPIRR